MGCTAVMSTARRVSTRARRRSTRLDDMDLEPTIAAFVPPEVARDGAEEQIEAAPPVPQFDRNRVRRDMLPWFDLHDKLHKVRLPNPCSQCGESWPDMVFAAVRRHGRNLEI